MTVELDPDFVTAAWRKLLAQRAWPALMVLTGRRRACSGATTWPR